MLLQSITNALETNGKILENQQSDGNNKNLLNVNYRTEKYDNGNNKLGG